MYYFLTVQRIKNILFELVPFMKEIKNTMNNFLQVNLTNFNESLHQLSAQLEEHKNQTAAELAQLQTSIHSTQSSLDKLANDFYEHQSEIKDQLQTNTQYLQNNLTQQLKDINNDIQQLPLCVYGENETFVEDNETNITESYTCGGTGWRRVVYLNMTDPTSNCPSGWQLTGYSKRTCGRANSTGRSCDSAIFPVSGGEYSKICGQIAAYQFGTTNGFYAYNTGHVTTIDGYHFRI